MYNEKNKYSCINNLEYIIKDTMDTHNGFKLPEYEKKLLLDVFDPHLPS